MTSVSPLDALRAVDFDGTLHLASVWATPRFDVNGLHAEVRRELLTVLDELASQNEPRSPLGRVIVGSGGTGKTHLLSVLRREASQRGCSFVLIDMTAVRDFPATVLQGLVDSLGRTIDGPGEANGPEASSEQQPQYRTLLARLLSTFELAEPVSRSIEKLEHFSPDRLLRNIALLLTEMSRRHPPETMQFQDALRALIALNSRDLQVSTLGLRWLQASELDTDERRMLGFTRSQSEPFEIVRAMSWLMSLCGPTVIAFDQLDPIVHQLQLANAHAEAGESLPQSVLAARSIVEQIAGGLSALRDVTRRTLLVVSCVEATLDVLRRHALRQDLERFESPLMLGSLPDDAVARSVVVQRLGDAFDRTGFSPPWPTWPFRPELFDNLLGLSPREILRLCAEHRRRCLIRGQVVELSSFAVDEDAHQHGSSPGEGASESGEREVSIPFRKQAHELVHESISKPDGGKSDGSPVPTEQQMLDAEFDRLKSEADPASLLAKLHDDERLAPLLQTACRCLIRECRLPEGVDASVETDFGNPKLPPLHARLRLVQSGDETERHLCLRALQRDNATAFQTRLKSALTASGIAADLPFRRLAIFRRGSVPSGPATEQLLNEFREAGGWLISLSDDDLRTLQALNQLETTQSPAFVDWLKRRGPVSSLEGFRALTADWFP
ncbi:hypothetical protein GC176_01555 [bacterium]|nr:hypothetical protein [bacterium]